MDNFTIVRPEYLNHYGHLFGGMMLRWVDEFAWIASSQDYPGCSLVTVAMSDVQFRHKVENGSVLRFRIERIEQGKTSVRYGVEVFARRPTVAEERRVFSTEIVFVRLDERGRKISLPRPEFC